MAVTKDVLQTRKFFSVENIKLDRITTVLIFTYNADIVVSDI